MAKQLVTLKNDVVAKAGLCLWFSQEMLNVPHMYDTAHEAYLATKYRHNNKNFPDDVAVPVWFSWWGQLPGDTQKYEYDHAAVRTADSKIWSSPLSGTGRAWFASVDDLVRAFGNGMKYVGWSEDISNVKVIGEDMPLIENREQARLIYTVALHRDGNKVAIKDLDGLIGQDVYKVLDKMRSDTPDGAEWNQANDILGRAYPLVKSQLAEAKKQLASSVPSEAEMKLQAIKDALGIK